MFYYAANIPLVTYYAQNNADIAIVGAIPKLESSKLLHLLLDTFH